MVRTCRPCRSSGGLAVGSMTLKLPKDVKELSRRFSFFCERVRERRLAKIVCDACSQPPTSSSGAFDDRIPEKQSPDGSFYYREEIEWDSRVENTLRLRLGLPIDGPGRKLKSREKEWWLDGF